MKKNNILKVLLILIGVAIIFTWLFPIISYNVTNSSLVEYDRVQVGLFDISSYTGVLFNFAHVLLLVLSIAAFYGVAYRIPAYSALLDKIVEKFKGKETIFLIAVMSIISIIVSLTGFQLGMLFVFPFVISIILLMGYNKLVAASATVGSVIVGMVGTTLGIRIYEYYNIIGENNIMGINGLLDVGFYNEIITRIVILIIALALLCLNVIMYAKKTRNETDRELGFVPFRNRVAPVAANEEIVAKDIKVEKVEKKEVKKETTKKNDTSKKASKKKAPAKKSSKTKANNAMAADVKVVKNDGKNYNIWPFVVIFDVALLIMLLSVFNWTSAGATWATDAYNAIVKFKVFGFPIFGKILGSSIRPFGYWDYSYEIPFVISLFTLILGLVYRLKFDDMFAGIVEGMKRVVVPILVMFLAYFVLIIVSYSPLVLYVPKFLFWVFDGVDVPMVLDSIIKVIILTISTFISSVLNIEPLYLAQSTLPYFQDVLSNTSLNPALGVITRSIYGLAMLIAPTSVILIGTLSYLDISYTRWIKHIWKFFLELLGILLLIFVILYVICSLKIS